MRYKTVSLALLVALLGASLSLPNVSAIAQSMSHTTIRSLSRRTTVVAPQGTTPVATNNGNPQTHEFPPEEREAEQRAPNGRLMRGPHRSLSPRPDPSALSDALRRSVAAVSAVPVGNDQDLSRNLSKVEKRLNGLTMFDQRYANNGNQFSVEPPDQALCVGNGFILESVNDVLRIYSTSGRSLSAVIDLNSFYGYPAQFDRTTLLQGPFVTDPVCYFDKDTRRWFHVVLTLDVQADTGAFLGSNHLDIAVSKTSNPMGEWNIYSLAAQNDGSDATPVHTDCPCIGDYPHIGADRYGFYITTNEYPFTDDPGTYGNNFNGAQIYALPKRALARGDDAISYVHFDGVESSAGTPGFTIIPAKSPNGSYNTHTNGTEYMLSSMAAEEALNTTGFDNRIALWTLTNTRSLDSASPELSLSATVIETEVYGVPPRSTQKPGPLPLRDCLLIGCQEGIGPSITETISPLDSGDSRMYEVVYANDRVWGALGTIVNVGDTFQAGAAYFIFRPANNPSNTTITKQGYVAVAGNNVIYPTVGALDNGKAVLSFTLVGNDYYPSAAYAPMDKQGVDDIRILAAGKGPQDSFSGYSFFSAPDPARPRWGDYGATAVDGSRIWVAAEYIGQRCTFAEFDLDPTCGGKRAFLGNWATHIASIRP